MISFEEAGAILEELSAELPEEFFRELNGGVCLLPDSKRHPSAKERDDLYILGEYHHNGQMGRYITIYYGSFLKLFGGISHSVLKERLRKTLRHEFRHHMESLGGERGLEIKDAIRLERYEREGIWE